MNKKFFGVAMAFALAFSGTLAFAEDTAIAAGETSMTMDAGATADRIMPRAKPPLAPIRKVLINAQKDVRVQAAETRKGIIQDAEATRATIRQDAQAAVKNLREQNTGKPLDIRMDVKNIRMEAQASSTADRMKAQAALKANMTVRVEALKENREQFKTDMEARKEAMSAKIEQQKKQMQEKRTKLQEAAKARVQEQLKTIFARFDARVASITQIDTKIATELNTRATAGADTTAATAQYKIAQTALEKAKADIEAAKSLAATEVSADTSKETLRTLVKTAEESLQAATVEYRKTIELLRPKKTATSASVKVETSASAEVTQ